MQASLLGRGPAVGLAAPQRRSVRMTHAASASARPQAVMPLKSAFHAGGVGTNCLRARQPAAKRAAPVAATAMSSAALDPDEQPGFLGIPNITWKKIVPLGFMFFAILFNYTILRDTKDVLVVTAPGSGAEIIPFLKTWVNLPAAIGFTVLYAKLANILSTEQLFYACIIPFIAFFGAFAFILYPLRERLHPTEFAANLLGKLGPRAAGPIAILRNWTFCLFYVMAELWGSVVVSLLFWGFANQITTVDEAKQFYPLFGLGANVALIFSGRAVVAFSKLRGRLPAGVDGWGVSLRGLMGMVVIGGLLVCATYFWLQRTVVPGVVAKLPPKPKKHKAEMSIGESFTFLAKSTYIRDLATLVVAYGISINLVEVTWKSKIKQQFPNPNDYSQFMGNFSTATGSVTFLMMLLSRYIFRKFGWGVAAAITPTVLLITGVLFFSLVLFGAPLNPMLATFGLTPLMAAVLVGAAQNVFSKSSKYSLFDPCKEMAYIPLDQETQLKGKAAIDVICNPLGKSGGALIQQFMIISFGSLAASTPYLGGILLVIVLLWLNSARSLDKQFTELQVEQMRLKKQQQQQETGTGRKYKFVSQLNDQGFIEGKYVLVSDMSTVKPDDVLLASQDVPPGQKA
jgi:AAA family ATP:ADP antiporter